MRTWAGCEMKRPVIVKSQVGKRIPFAINGYKECEIWDIMALFLLVAMVNVVLKYSLMLAFFS